MKYIIRTTMAGLGVVSLALAACETPSPNGGSTSTLADWQDPIGTLTLPASNIGEIKYGSGGDHFHRALHSSMKGNVDVIDVDMGDDARVNLDDIRQSRTSLMANDPGLLRWTTRINLSGGEIMACRNTPPESGLWALLALVSQIAAPWVNEWLAYRDAQDYHAVVFYDPVTEVISRTKFVHRAHIDMSALTCDAASGL